MSDRRSDEGLLSGYEYREPAPQETTPAQGRKCDVCGTEIHPERLEALPDTRTCVAHSNEPAKIGYLVFSHKTAPVFCTIDPRDREAVRRATRANRRHR